MKDLYLSHVYDKIKSYSIKTFLEYVDVKVDEKNKETYFDIYREGERMLSFMVEDRTSGRQLHFAIDTEREEVQFGLDVEDTFIAIGDPKPLESPEAKEEIVSLVLNLLK